MSESCQVANIALSQICLHLLEKRTLITWLSSNVTSSRKSSLPISSVFPGCCVPSIVAWSAFDGILILTTSCLPLAPSEAPQGQDACLGFLSRAWLTPGLFIPLFLQFSSSLEGRSFRITETLTPALPIFSWAVSSPFVLWFPHQ